MSTKTAPPIDETDISALCKHFGISEKDMFRVSNNVAEDFELCTDLQKSAIALGFRYGVRYALRNALMAQKAK